MCADSPPIFPLRVAVASVRTLSRDPCALFEAGYERLGSVVRYRLGPFNLVVVADPEYQQRYLEQVDNALTVEGVYDFVKPMFGQFALAEPDFKRRRAQIRWLNEVFMRQLRPSYTGGIVAVSRRLAASMSARGGGTVDPGQFADRVALSIAVYSLFNNFHEEDLEAIDECMRDLGNSMEVLLPQWLPLAKFRRRDRARERLQRIITRWFASAGADVPARQLFAGGSGDTRPVDDPLGALAFVLFTTQASTAALLHWVLASAAMQTEAVRLISNLPAAERTDGWLSFVLEVARLYPVMAFNSRRVESEFMLGGFRMRRGWHVGVAPNVSHRLEQSFASPNEFVWNRFLGEKKRSARPPAYLAFSGGVYACPGRDLGLMSVTQVIETICANYQLVVNQSALKRHMMRGMVRPRCSALTVTPRPDRTIDEV